MKSRSILGPIQFRLARFSALGTLAIAFSVAACAGADRGTESDSVGNAIEAADGGSAGTDLYAGVLGLQGDQLKAALHDLVKNQRPLGYDRARKVIFSDPTFITPDHQVECVYTGRLVPATGSTTTGGFNTEHSWPQSMGASHEPARSDLHHLFAVDGQANSSRGNHPFDFVTCAQGDAGTSCSFSEGGSALGKNTLGQTSFQVRDAKRGDIARAHFYFSVRYELHIPVSEEKALREWSDEDPIDDGERARNDAIEQQQKNRNPFVDHPEFITAITDF